MSITTAYNMQIAFWNLIDKVKLTNRDVHTFNNDFCTIWYKRSIMLTQKSSMTFELSTE